MERRKNRLVAFLLGVLTIFLLCLQALPIFSAAPSPVEMVNVKAAEPVENVTELPRSDSLFEFQQGAFMQRSSALNILGFAYRILNPDVFKFNVKEGGDDWANFEFTVYRSVTEEGGIDEKAYPVYRLRLLCYKGITIVGHKRMLIEGAVVEDAAIKDGQVVIGPDQKTNEADGQNITKTWSASDVKAMTASTAEEVAVMGLAAEFEESGYVFDYASVHPNKDIPFFTREKDGYSVLGILIETNSPHSDYFVTACSMISRWEGKTKKDGWIFPKVVKVYNSYVSLTRSDTRSVKTWVENCNAAGALETELGDDMLAIERANDILYNTETKLCDVTYLENIGNTPFARKVTKKILLPVTKGAICYDDVCNALGVNSLNALNASVDSFIQDDIGVYHAQYLSSTHAIVRTEGGKGVDYYLDCNHSFADYYQQYVDLGAFKVEAFEYALNEIKTVYPVLEGYTADSLYGLWGYVISPQESTWTHLWSEIFDRPADYKGSFKSYQTRTFVNISEYYEKLKEYGYNWLERVWQVWGGIWTNAAQYEVVHYLFYADPKTPEIGIGENGDVENDEGLIENDINKTAQAVVDLVEKQAENVKEQTNSLLRVVLAIVGIVGAVALVLGVIYIYYRYIAPEKKKARK